MSFWYRLFRNITEAIGYTAIAEKVTGAAIYFGYVSGTLKARMILKPGASEATTGITNKHYLLCVGDMTGSTAYGMGDPTIQTTGDGGTFGRTVIATSSFTGMDTAFDRRMINKLVNDTAYKMQGAYIKCKNYSTGTVGKMRGMFIEVVNDGTATAPTAIEVGSDTGTVDAVLDMTNAAITATKPIFLFPGGTAGFFLYAGSPESHCTSTAGGFCLDVTNGAAYVKTGTGNTGWKLVTQAG